MVELAEVLKSLLEGRVHQDHIHEVALFEMVQGVAMAGIKHKHSLVLPMLKAQVCYLFTFVFVCIYFFYVQQIAFVLFVEYFSHLVLAREWKANHNDSDWVIRCFLLCFHRSTMPK